MTNEPTPPTRPRPTALGRPGQAVHGLQRKAGALVRYLAARKAWFLIPYSLFMGLGLASCTDRDEEVGSLTAIADATSAQITLYISMSDAASTRAATRADESTWSSDYTSAEATTFENTISSLQVLFFKTDGTLAAAAEKKSFWSYGEDGDQYEYVGTIDVSSAAFTTTTTNDDGSTSTSFSGKVMVLANCPDAASFLEKKTSTDTDLTFIGSLTYDYADITGETGLPMWGMTTATSLTFASGYNTSLGTISLLRAVSKILVAFDDDTYADGFSLTGLAVNRYLDAGYCLPTGYDTASSTTDLGLESCQNVYEEAGTVVGTSTVTTTYTYTDDDGNTTTTTTTSDSGTLTGQVTTVSTTYAYADGSECSDTLLWFNADNGGRILYLPEYDNTSSTAEHVALTLAISRTVENDDDDGFNPYTGSMTLYLGEYTTEGSTDGASVYTENSDYGLVRNHVYSFELSELDKSEVYVVSTDAWEDATSTISWDMGSSTVEWLPYGYDDDNATKGDAEAVYSVLLYPRWTDDTHTETENSSYAASYVFKVPTPTDEDGNELGRITWKAYLSKEYDTTYFKFSTGTADGTDNTYNVTTGVSRTDPYSLKISCSVHWAMIDANDKAYNDNDSVGVYTDIFVLVTKADDSVVPLDINPTRPSTGYFSPNRYPGGNKEREVTYTDENGDTKTVTLGEHQWIRMWQTKALISEGETYYGYDDLVKYIEQYVPDDEKYYVGSSSSSSLKSPSP